MTSIIYGYTRAEAIADGALCDVSAVAAEAGFKVPVAMTDTAWDNTVEWPIDLGTHQDERGRLWDVVFMASLAAKAGLNTDQVPFVVARVDRAHPECPAVPVTLILHVGPGDDAEPVVTILRQGEA